ncbi:MAG: leucine-rich repeat domain-containing protein [Candidatus Hodarchaeota archaeon]
MTFILRRGENIDYHGVQLEQPEYEAMMDLEREIGEEIRQAENFEMYHFGFKAKNGHVVKLKLLNKSLKKLPESIGNLNQLRLLHVMDNELELVPDSIVNLVKLEDLGLAFNKIAEFPRLVEKLTSLKVLDLAENKIEAYPESIGLYLKRKGRDGYYKGKPGVKERARFLLDYTLENFVLVFYTIILPCIVGAGGGFLFNLFAFNVFYALLNPNWYAILIPPGIGVLIHILMYKSIKAKVRKEEEGTS